MRVLSTTGAGYQGISTEDTDNKDNLLDEKSPVQSTCLTTFSKKKK